MRVLITGISGFIGSHLAEYCLTKGLIVRGLCRDTRSTHQLITHGVEIVCGDLLDLSEVETAVEGCDIVVHVGGWSGGADVPEDIAWKTNVDGTINIISAAKKAGVKRLLYVSSVAVYGLNSALTITEDMPTPKVGELYPDSKIEAEGIVKNSDLPFTIIRPGCIYGPRGKAWTVDIFKKITDGTLILGNGGGYITPGYIDNFIYGTYLAMMSQDAEFQIFNMCDESPMTYSKFYSSFAHLMGIQGLPKQSALKVWLLRSWAAPILRRLFNRQQIGKWTDHFRFNPSVYSIEKAKTILNYKPLIDFEKSMLLTYEWWISNN